MGNSSSLDKMVWRELNQHWTSVTLEAAAQYERLAMDNGISPIVDIAHDLAAEGVAIPEGKTRSVQVRVNQARFRRAVLTSYNSTCCVSGLTGC
jgi:putative restriction endonuclease